MCFIIQVKNGTIKFDTIGIGTGTVSAYEYCASILGSSCSSSTQHPRVISFENCYSHATLTTTYGRAGGLYIVNTLQAKMKNCYFSGTINAAYDRVGPLAGVDDSSYDDSKYDSCYYNKTKYTKNFKTTATGLTTADFKNSSKFVGWDFQNVWIIKDEYPELRIFIKD